MEQTAESKKSYFPEVLASLSSVTSTRQSAHTG
jgi:hypothetical protein